MTGTSKTGSKITWAWVCLITDNIPCWPVLQQTIHVHNEIKNNIIVRCYIFLICMSINIFPYKIFFCIYLHFISDSAINTIRRNREKGEECRMSKVASKENVPKKKRTQEKRYPNFSRYVFSFSLLKRFAPLFLGSSSMSPLSPLI